jgi:hypothetical protein
LQHEDNHNNWPKQHQQQQQLQLVAKRAQTEQESPYERSSLNKKSKVHIHAYRPQRRRLNIIMRLTRQLEAFIMNQHPTSSKQHSFNHMILPILVACSLSSVQILAQIAPPAPTITQHTLSATNGTDNLQSSTSTTTAEHQNHHHPTGTGEASGGLIEAKGLMYGTGYSIVDNVTQPQFTPQKQQPAIIQNLSKINSENNNGATQANLYEEVTTIRTATDTTLTSTQAAINAAAMSMQPSSDAPKPSEPTPDSISQQSSTLVQQQQQQQQQQPPHCSLGEDTYQIGERWNPNLPPFGVQVCVLCECTVRQRKSCYEAKVTCRRITNECPVIDSCPDGKKPVTIAGQCCKSCQSTTNGPLSQQLDANLLSQQQQQPQQQAQSIGTQSPAYESQLQLKQTPTSTTSFRIVYMNERTKDYMSLVKNLPACNSRESDSTTTKAPQQQVPVNVATTLAPPTPPQAPKVAKGNRNDLNGIDTRLAFKSLNDAVSNHIGSTKSRHMSDTVTATHQQQHDASSSSSSSRHFDHSPDDHQHPNDVQSATASTRTHPHQHSVSSAIYSSNNAGPRQLSHPGSCKLGNDTFHVGDVWNPILPPFGVQVCVQCNCIFRIRKGCFETKVTCRRINRDCPILDTCPDGNPPINVDGQCCKTCPTSLTSNSAIEQEPTGDVNIFQPTTLPLNGIMRNERVYKEFFALTRNLNICVKSRESIDIYNTNRYARKSRQA